MVVLKFPSRPLILILASVVTALPGYGQNTPPLNAKVQETLMGPTLASPGVSARLFLSEDGDHLAVVTAKGSRQVVLLDGVEGPVFDEIPSMLLGVQTPVQWSPTGGRSAYIGRRGGEFIVVIDGKETGTLMTVQSQQGVSYSQGTGWKFWFSNDGARLAYAAIAGPGAWVMVVDGVKSPPYRLIDFRQVFLNGKRLVFVAQTTDQQSHVVVDGKPGPAYGGIQSLQVTPDGAHYAYVGQPAGSPNPVVVVDGVVEGQGYRGIGDLEQAPDGRVAYVAAKTVPPGAAHGGGTGVLVVAGKEQAGSCGNGNSPICLTFSNRLPGPLNQNTPLRHVAWSPDGKGFAYIQSNSPNPDVTVMVNGKQMGPAYKSAHGLTWSPDGSRFAYLGTSPNGFFQVIDGEELQAINDVPEFQWSPDGKRYSFVGYGGGKGFTVIVDGKEQPKTQGPIQGSLRWSPDGKHFVYGAQTSLTSYQAVMDGVVKPAFLGDFFALNRVQPQLTFPALLFSPDGTRLAYVGRDAAGKTAVYVDDAKYQGPTPSYTFPSFSPDSRHFATVVTTGTGWGVLLDGKMGPIYEDMVLNSVAASRFVNDRTYRFYGIKGGQIFRVTLDIG